VKFLRKFLDKQEKHFTRGGKLEKLFPIFEMTDTILYTSGKVTKEATHVRDVLDLKRMMIMVVIALVPAVLMAFYNTGYQANLALSSTGLAMAEGWRGSLMSALGFGVNPENFFDNFLLGGLYFLPVYGLTLMVGGFWEVLFAVIRKHEIAEGFLVTSLLFPLILPPNIPLWQVAVGASFGIVFGKELFGGVGMNIFNPALMGRAFLFFAYPAQISGDKVWVAVDGVSQATPLAQFSDTALDVTSSWMDSFLGLIPGSMGETSTLAILIGALILIITGIGSLRVMLTITLSMALTVLFFNWVGSDTNSMFAVTPAWHFVTGGFAFGMVFMATDPVSSAFTKGGQIIYGITIGVLVVLIRVVNPAYPEGMMLAILFGNMFAPYYDRIYLNKNIKRRAARNVS